MSVKRYKVRVETGKSGQTRETILKLNDAEAKAMGLLKEPKRAEAKKAPAPANKARTPKNKRG